MDIGIRHNKSDKLWRFSEELTYICILGALWFLCSLPIVSIGAANIAMYTVFMGHITQGRKELVKPFFSAFKENFKNATILWLIIFPAMILFTVDAFYYLHLPGNSIFHKIMGVAMLCLLAILIMVSCYAFPMMALYNNNVKIILIESLHYSYINWPWTLLTFMINVGVLVLMSIGLWYFAFLFVGIIGYVNSHIMLKAFR